jgi:hypothetical protein
MSLLLRSRASGVAALLLVLLLPAPAPAQIAFRAASQAGIASTAPPAFQAAGTAVGGTGNVTPTWPAHQADDIALLFIESTGGQAANLSVPAGFAPVLNSPVSTGAGTTGTRLTVYWARATSGAMPAPTVADPGNHAYAQILTYRGVVQSGDPWDVTGGGVKAVASTSVTVTGVTTTVPNTLIVQAVARDNDSAAAAFSAQTNANLTGIAERSDAGTTAGNGGGIGIWDGVMAAAGATGNTTATVTSSINAFLTIALRPQPLTIAVPAGTLANDVMIASITFRPCSATSGGACTTTITPPAGWTQVNTVTDQTTGGGTGGFGNRLFVYRRVAGASEPANYTWTLGGTPVHAGAAGGMISFSGVDTASPVVAEAGQVTPSLTSHAAPSVDTGAVINTMLVSSHSANSSTLWTPPGGMTERVDAASLAVPNDLGLALEMNHELRAAAGATGTRTAGWTAPPAADTGITHMLALRPAVHHYAISVLSASVANCDFAEVTITAHNAAHGAVIAPSSRIVTLSTSVGTGVWQAGLVSGGGTWTPSGSNDGAATYQWSGAESSFTVRLRQSAVTSLSVNLLDNAGIAEDPTEDPTISFANSGFRISNGANAALSIGTQIAGKPSNTGAGSQSLFLQAVRADTATGACASLFPSGSEIDIEVGAQCNNPAACTRNVTLTTTSGSGSPTGNFVPAGAGTYPATIRFRFTTANAEAPFFFSYADAGQITLQFRRVSTTPPPTVTITGTSNPFVVRPFGLAFRGANAATAVQHGTLPTSPLLAAAGDNFTLTLVGYQWNSVKQDADNDGVPDLTAKGIDITGNGDTPNFAWDTSVFAASNLPGIVLGTIDRASGGATVFAKEFSSGAATVTDWRYSEAGNAELLSITSDYIEAGVNILGHSGYDGTGTSGGHVGRFRPKHFEVDTSVGNQPTLANRAALLPCSSTFSYLGENMRLTFRLLARNAQGATTQNYTGTYARLDPSSTAAFNFGARSGATVLTSRVSASYPGAAPAWSNGVLSIPLAAPIHISIARAASPDGPHASLQFGIAPADPDGVAMNVLDLDADSTPGFERKNLGVSTELRFGRLRIGSAHGSQLVTLRVPMEAQHWNGTSFITNTADSCTIIAGANIELLNYTQNLNACESSVLISGAFSSGRGNLRLTAPGSANNGSVDLRAHLGSTTSGETTCIGGSSAPVTAANMLFLRGNWTGAAYDQDPTARARFGIYRSADEVIFIRENF